MKNPKILETKEKLKLLAGLIRRNRKIFRQSFSVADRKWNPNQPEFGYWEKWNSWSDARWDEITKYRDENKYENYEKFKHEFRHLHIAYCELRGRKREQIEKPRESNEPNETLIEQYKKDILAGATNEDVCAPAV